MSEQLQLADVCEVIIDCKNRTPPECSEGERYGYAIGTPHIKNSRILLREAKPVSRTTFDTWTARGIPRFGDLIITREAPVGLVARIETDEKICLGQRTMLARIDEKLANSRFIYYLLRSSSIQDVLHGMASGSTVPHLKVGDVKGLNLSGLPDIAGQSAIAEVLGSLDDKIDINEHILETSRKLGMAYFEWLTEAGSADPVSLGSVAAMVSRGVAPKYSENPDELIVLNQKCIRGGAVSLAPSRRTIAEKVKEPKRLRRNDVLINSTGVGTLGRIARWTLDGPATVDSHVTIVRFDADKVDPVCAGFAMLRAEAEIEALGEGSTGQTELKRAQLEEFAIALPSAQDQVALGRKLEALEDRVDQAAKESIALAELRDTLLPKLMSGELRIKDAERIVEDAT